MTNGRLTRNETLAGCGIRTTRIEDDVIVMNRNDIASITESGNIVSSIDLKPGKVAFRFTGRDCFATAFSMEAGAYANSFRHTLMLYMLTRTQACKDGAGQLKDCRLLAITKNAERVNESTRYELHGLRNGLEAESLSYDSANGDGIVSAIRLSNSDGRLEAAPPASVWAGSLAATEQLLDSLFGEMIFHLNVNALGSAYRLN